MNKIILLSLLFFFCAMPLKAHPHVFIKHTIKIIFDESGLSGIEASWRFDTMFSSTLIHDYDINKNRIFEHDEVLILKEEAFSNLKHYHYFTHIEINNKTFNPKYVKDFKAVIFNKNVTYTFFIPCHVSIHNEKKKITLSFYDDTYFVDFDLIRKDKISLRNSEKYNIVYSIKDNSKKSYYYGQVCPRELILIINTKNT
jgi:ABC-type uncharacterized transport system substrate-binding protein